jgi:hypothetical protein
MNTNNNIKLTYDYYIYLLLNKDLLRKNKEENMDQQIKWNWIIKTYQYTTMFLYINFYNTVDYLKYKYFNTPIVEAKHLYEGINLFTKD